MARKPVEIEVSLQKNQDPICRRDELNLFQLLVILKSLFLGENPSVERQVEKNSMIQM